MEAIFQGYLDKLNRLDTQAMFNSDFLLTWEKTDQELAAVLPLPTPSAA